MLLLDAEIYFDTLEENPHASPWDLKLVHPLRPAINFGRDLLFSGTLLPDKTDLILNRGKWYRVTIEMPTIDDEAYDMIKDLVKIDNVFKMQAGSRVVGKGKILDYVYQDYSYE